MIYGCDHGGRGRNVVEFGDYFRTQRWNQGPGCDQPGLGRDLIKNKVASSIAHLYQRPRVWLEGYLWQRLGHVQCGADRRDVCELCPRTEPADPARSVLLDPRWLVGMGAPLQPFPHALLAAHAGLHGLRATAQLSVEPG